MVNIVSLDKRASYEEALNEHLSLLTDEQRESKINDMMIVYSGDLGGAFSLVEGENIQSLIGLLEMIKIYLITSGVDYE